MSVTVASLILRAQQRADMENSKHVSDAEWLTYIDIGYKALYDVLVSKFEDYYTTTTTFTVASGDSTAPLPTDFYKMRGLDRADGGSDYYSLRPFNFENRNRKGFYQRYRGIEPSVQYRIMSGSLIFEPTDQAAGNYKLWYIPAATSITSTAQTIDGVNGWEEFIVITAAMKALIKEESDVSVLAAEQNDIRARIEHMAQSRDAGQTERISDVSHNGYHEPFFYR